MQTIILSGSIHETYAWADAQGRHRRTVRHIPHAASLQGRGYDGIVELPSFAGRRDRHAVLAQLRRLRRTMPNIPYELDEDWVMPEPPKKVEKKHIDPEVFRFSNTPEAIEMPQEIADLTDADVYGITIEADVSQAVRALAEAQDELNSITEEVGQVSDELTVVAEDLKDEKYDAIAEISELGSDEPSPMPKRKGRRTNEQKAYDEALVAQEENPGDRATTDALIAAEEALRKRHPDDERLYGHPLHDPRNEPDLDF